jgi:hypothetical protein
MKSSLGKNLLLIASGLVAGVALVVACGTDGGGPSDASAADAGACNCPSAEAPLDGRIRRKQVAIPIQTTGITSAVVSCEAGGIILGGGCGKKFKRDGIVISESSMTGGAAVDVGVAEGQDFWCAAENTTGSATDEVMIVNAICLYPAE